jgi:ribosomal protein L44E
LVFYIQLIGENFMKMPAKFNTYCPHCRNHQMHEVEKVKKGKTTGLHWIDRQKARRGKVGNMGKFSKVPGGDKRAVPLCYLRKGTPAQGLPGR